MTSARMPDLLRYLPAFAARRSESRLTVRSSDCGAGGHCVDARRGTREQPWCL